MYLCIWHALIFFVTVFSHLQLSIVDFVPTLLYFGYTTVMVIGFWLLTGTIGFYATYIFVCHIYGAVKQD